MRELEPQECGEVQEMSFRMPLGDFVEKLMERRLGNIEASAEDYDDYEAIELEEKGVIQYY